MLDMSQKDFDTEVDLTFAAVDEMVRNDEVSTADTLGIFPQGQISSRYREEE